MITPISIIFALSLTACSNGVDKEGEEIGLEPSGEPSGEPTDEPSGEPSDDPDPDPELSDPNHDYDGDGFTENQGDCDDSNSQINPDALDRVIDGVDQNCDNVDGMDEDQDGYVDVASVEMTVTMTIQMSIRVPQRIQMMGLMVLTVMAQEIQDFTLYQKNR